MCGSVQATGPRERVTPLRLRLVSRLLADAVQSVAASHETPVVLDCGGGSGTSAVPLAREGARVTVVDVSADALATLHRRAVEAGVDALVLAVQGDIETLDDLVPPASFDLVLAHGVLEAVDHPDAALAGIARAVRPGGRVSILIGNPVAGVLARALAGDLSTALMELRAIAESPPGALSSTGLRAMCGQVGLLVEQVHGVGVFSELVPGAELDGHPGAAEALAEMEELASGLAPYRDIASRIHLLARRAPS